MAKSRKDESTDSIKKSFELFSDEDKFEKLVECLYNFFDSKDLEEFSEFIEEELE